MIRCPAVPAQALVLCTTADGAATRTKKQKVRCVSVPVSGPPWRNSAFQKTGSKSDSSHFRDFLFGIPSSPAAADGSIHTGTCIHAQLRARGKGDCTVKITAITKGISCGLRNRHF